jgi:hypothetical protein
LRRPRHSAADLLATIEHHRLREESATSRGPLALVVVEVSSQRRRTVSEVTDDLRHRVEQIRPP